ncbi:aspartyl protease family protein [Bacteroidota bacterium]
MKASSNQKLIVLLSIFLSSCSIINVNRIRSFGEISDFEESIIIPFELKGHTIYVKGNLNNIDKKYTFIFDTGALTAIDEEFAKEINVTKTGSLPTPDTSIKMYIGKLNSLQFDDLEMNNCWVAITNSFKSFNGDTIGFLGSNSLRNFVVSINYDTQELILSMNKIEVDANSTTYVSELDLHPLVGWPLVDIKLKGDKEVVANAMVDAGMPYVIVLPSSYKDKLYNQNSKLVIKSNGVFLEWPFWKTDTNYISIMDKITIGDLELHNVLVYYANTGGNVLLGKGFFDKFKTHIDYKRKQIVFEQKHPLDYADNLFTTGMYITKKDSRVFIKAVLENSPAFESSLKPGDEILEINSKEVNRMSYYEIIDILSNDKTNEINIRVKNNENFEQELKLKKRLLFKY